MTYVDGFVLAVPEDKLEVYRDMAQVAGKVWIEHGALEYRECVGDDMEEKEYCGSFPKLFGLREGEVAVFAFIVFKNREHRDQVNTAVMADPRIQESCGAGEMPFDPKRMAYGGFRTLVEFEHG